MYMFKLKLRKLVFILILMKCLALHFIIIVKLSNVILLHVLGNSFNQERVNLNFINWLDMTTQSVKSLREK